MQPRINLITLGVRDLTRAIAFYEAMGLPRHPFEGETIAFFELNGTWLALYPRDALALEAGMSAEGGGFGGFTLAHNVASREEVDEVLAQAVAAGAYQTRSAAETAWGGYSGYFVDPEGFLWEVAHVPQFWIGPRE